MDFKCLTDIVQAVDGFQKAHPHLSVMMTAELMYVIGDAAAQWVLDKKLNKRKLAYTAALAPLYGLCIDGLMQTGELVGKYINSNPLVKAALGPNLIGNASNTIFFYNNTMGEKTNYSIPALLKGYASIFSPAEIKKNGFLNNLNKKFISYIPGREYLKTLIATLTAWNAFQWLNYAVVPEHRRTYAVLLVGTVWTGIITSWSSKGAKNKLKQDITRASQIGDDRPYSA